MYDTSLEFLRIEKFNKDNYYKFRNYRNTERVN